MTQQHDFLKQFAFGGKLSYALNTPTNRRVIDVGSIDSLEIPPTRDVYFGPAMRTGPGDKKEDVLGTKALWVDADSVEKPLATLPPSMIVFSGHGWHLYWILDEVLSDREQIEVLNKVLVEDVPTADKASWNCNRVLRIPETLNLKDPEKPVNVDLKTFRPNITYAIEDFGVLTKLNDKTRHKIRTGDRRGYNSRSERDWAIVTSLITAGASDRLIQTIFEHQTCGDKASENEHYLPRTIKTARESKAKIALVDQKSLSEKTDFVEGEDGYYVVGRRPRRVSTFLLEPKVLLDGSPFESPDSIVCDVAANEYTWENVTFSRGAFTSVSKWDREAPVSAWQFLGSDSDVRKMLPHLLTKLRDMGLPKVAATRTLGLYNINNRWVFLGDSQVISKDDTWFAFDGPICWLPTQQEHPTLDLTPKITPEELSLVAELVPELNEAGTIWPMVGWYSATCLKPWLEEQKYRFPILNVAGTRGSGKTTLIQRVFMPLMGQTDPKTFDSGTTRFVTLALLGSSNAIPIAFSEFRYEMVERFLRFILLSYDTGHDPRGRGDQTTVDYPLSAPFSIDGEDLVEDPASQERIVVCRMHPETVAEDSPAYKAFNKLRKQLPPRFGGYFIQQVLKRMDDLPTMLKDSRTAIFEAFPKRLPDRVRANHIVAYFGVRLWCDILGVTSPDAEVMRDSISSVYDIEAGRARTLADAMIEDLVNAVASGNPWFNSAYDNNSNTLWFQLAPAHTWWLSSRRRQGRGALERDAIRAQLREAPYVVGPQVLLDAWMYGVDLKQAHEAGLDVPLKISERKFVVRF